MICFRSLGLITALLSSSADAGIDLPRGVYLFDQIEEASAEAEKEEKALAFILSDPDTTCGLCIGATELAFEKLKAHSVIVFINSELTNPWDHVSPMVVTGLSEPQVGHNIPKAVVTSPDMSEIWFQMGYTKLKNEDSYRDARKQVNAILKGEEEPESPADRAIYWPLKGKDLHYTGSFVGLDESGKLRLKMQKDGKLATIPLDRLTPQSAVFARMLAGKEGNSDSEPASADEPELESWTGSNGKTLQARFIRLVDDKVTLEMEDGKTYTLPLDRLAESSRERARELAGE